MRCISKAHVARGGFEGAQSVERGQGSLHASPSHERNLSKQDKGSFVKGPPADQIHPRQSFQLRGAVPWPTSLYISVPRRRWPAPTPPSATSWPPGAVAPGSVASSPSSTVAPSRIWV